MIDRVKTKNKLVTALTALLNQGLFVEDVVEALRSSVAHRRAIANGERSPRRREELLLFYSDADAVLRDASRRLDTAGRSAKMIAGT